MYQIATTLQFRKAVRKHLEKKGIGYNDSYTNMGVAGMRTVGFQIPTATPKLARKIEKKLNKQGLTAKTRHTSDWYRNSPCQYIRGTCTFVK